jgi:hypothetical protein
MEQEEWEAGGCSFVLKSCGIHTKRKAKRLSPQMLGSSRALWT